MANGTSPPKDAAYQQVEDRTAPASRRVRCGSPVPPGCRVLQSSRPFPDMMRSTFLSILSSRVLLCFAEEKWRR
jgi:hypothetical protein